MNAYLKSIFILSFITSLFSCQTNTNRTQIKAINTVKNDSISIISDTITEQKIDIIISLEKEYAPNFNLLNKNNTLVSNNDLLKYKKKLLVFTDRTCDHCIQFYPELEKFAKKHFNNFHIVVIQYDTSVKQLKETLSIKNYHFDMLAANDAVFIDYRITGTPTIMLLNEQNFILKNKDGLYSFQELEKLFIDKDNPL